MTASYSLNRYSYGLDEMQAQDSLDYGGENLSLSAEGNYQFEAYFKGEPLAEISLSIPGIHNARNALAAIAVAHQLGLPTTDAAGALAEFQGTQRRFEVRGEFSGIAVIDDYAHHPTEIKATLAAARNRYSGRNIWAVWQPHTYSRTSALLDDFLTAFQDADHVLVTEIYASREKSHANVSSSQFVQSIEHQDVQFLASNHQVTDYLIRNLKRGDVLMVLSAGDANQISDEVIDLLSVNGHGK
jgi:UDP-N-acetylmuramate--alanine ligase